MSLDVEALETSFDLIAPHGDELMDQFYSRLFAAEPGVQSLYPSDMKKQKAMFFSALVLLRKSLRDLDKILPALRAMGARHLGYGARPEHYATAGAILIETMAAIAGPAWKPEYERAWVAAFDVVAGAMLAGAAEAGLAAAA